MQTPIGLAPKAVQSHHHRTDRWTSPAVVLAIGLVLALVLAVLPRQFSGWIRDGVAAVLKPGQVVSLRLGRQSERAVAWTRAHFQAASRLVEAERQVQELKRENQQLAGELVAASLQPVSPRQDADEDADASRLLRARCVSARVLGRQARAFLARHHLLDVGTAAGVQPEAWVVAAPAVIDRGRDAELQPGQLVLHGRRVWGKIVQLGAQTSAVRAVTEPGYRDLVAIGNPSGPQGMVEGTGEPLARIRLVEATEPVSIGDAVYTAGQGVLPAPLLYGHVVRLQRPVGGHWEIWMEPAVVGPPQHAAVLKIELNPLRTAQQKTARSQ
ncbi:MAG: hypothetical protein JXB62_12715 [Pirellulales bacterium]|nr:hypothetical protein [Pirellulales bacterium]